MAEVKRSHKKKEVKGPAVDIRTVHRITEKGPHRIEIHSPDEPPILGEWAQAHQIAVLRSYRATLGHHFGNVLPHFFKVLEAPCRIVPDFPETALNMENKKPD